MIFAYRGVFRAHLFSHIGETEYPGDFEPYAKDKDGSGSGISGLYLWRIHIAIYKKGLKSI